jgi:Reverse transcriptase (RNA-dependent DNA polymerase)
LKQANRQWYAKRDAFLSVELGFTRNAADHCSYVRIKGGKTKPIALYVYDLLIACADKTSLNASKTALSMKFEMKDMGKAQKCLGLEIVRCRKDGKLTVCQFEYAKNGVGSVQYGEILLCKTPMDCRIDLATQVKLPRFLRILKQLGV